MAVKIRPARGKSGAFEYDIRFRWPDGETFRERANAPVSGRSAALRWANAREAELLARGRMSSPDKAVPTFAEFWPRVLSDHYIANRKKASTVATAKSIYRLHLAPLHPKTLDAIDNADVARIKGALKEAGPKTVNNVLSVLSRTLRCAVDWEVLSTMPCRIRLLPISEPAMEWYELEDYRRLVDAAALLEREVLIVVLLAGSAGLRRGEIRSLKWTDIDFVRSQLRIERATWSNIEGTTKGGRHRIVPMTAELATALKAHRHLRGERVLRGVEVSNRTIRNWMRRAQRKAGLPGDGGIHILRHTFCSHLAAAGVPAKAIQELAGHKDLKTTLRYMHLSPGDRDAAIGVLGRYQGAKPRQMCASADVS